MKNKWAMITIWTIGYVVFTAMFFYFLFDFIVWSHTDWWKIANATIRGLSGLAFGVSLITTIPIYIASVHYIYKNKKWPYTFPKPIKKEVKKVDLPKEPEKKPESKLPENLPAELKEPYIRIQSGQLSRNAIDFMKDMHIMSFKESEKELEPVSFMPVPDSFDTTNGHEHNTPMFKDMNFHDDIDEPDFEISDVEITETDGKKIATFVFDDPDFWVADDTDDWFATGKQIESPIKQLLAAIADEKVLVLKEKNIMNIEELIPTWEEKGITVKIS